MIQASTFSKDAQQISVADLQAKSMPLTGDCIGTQRKKRQSDTLALLIGHVALWSLAPSQLMHAVAAYGPAASPAKSIASLSARIWAPVLTGGTAAS